ncbi:MAG: carboxypeptidase-like regulatory domain-containing protein [Fodinibius sp.]|nr:carboxypeptidase-like regulatory domain-containing protein [Fodinibius sp.]
MYSRLIMIACCLMLPLSVFAQSTSYTITGELEDAENGEALVGANISFENLVIGTSTAADGTFEVEAEIKPGEYTLNFTFIGYKRATQTITLGDNSSVDLGTIQLQPDVIGTEEVVVTGASALTNKKQIGNSISTVSADELQTTGVSQIRCRAFGQDCRCPGKAEFW